jgi:hypothetical protein
MITIAGGIILAVLALIFWRILLAFAIFAFWIALIGGGGLALYFGMIA